MIVVDVSVIAYLLLPGEYTDAAVRVRRLDAGWAAPALWRSELQNVLATTMRTGGLDLQLAYEVMAASEDLMRGRTYVVPTHRVLECAAQSGCTAYDCEYVALARELDVPLVTTDAKVLRPFPEVAAAPKLFRPPR